MGMSETMKALADPVRRQILDILRKRSHNAGEIAEHFNLKGATISHHLAILKEAELVETEKYGTFVIYSLNTSLFEDVVEWMVKFKEEK